MVNKVNDMVRLLGADPTKPMRDSDGDKAVNILDCKPYDKNRQGFIHTIAAKGLRKVGATKQAERVEERGKEVDETRRLTHEARVKETRRFQVERERIIADQRLQRLKEAPARRQGIIKQFTSGFKSPPSQRLTATRRATTVRKKTATRRVKGKKGRARTRTVTRTIAPPRRQTLQEFTSSRFGGGF